MSNMRSVAEFLALSIGLLGVSVAIFDAFLLAFSIDGEDADSSKLPPLAFTEFAKRLSSSYKRDSRAIESIFARRPRSISSGSSGYFSNSSSSALPLFAKGRQARWFSRTTSSS